MNVVSLPFRNLIVVVASALVVACGPSQKTAQQAIDEADATIAAAGPDAKKYLRSEVAELQAESARLVDKLGKGEYVEVVTGAAALQEKAKALPAQAAAKRAEAERQLPIDWADLEISVPAAIAAASQMVEQLSASGKGGETVAAARQRVAEFRAFWEKAVAAKAAGNLESAVGMGKLAKQMLDKQIYDLEAAAG